MKFTKCLSYVLTYCLSMNIKQKNILKCIYLGPIGLYLLTCDLEFDHLELNQDDFKMFVILTQAKLIN